MEKIYCMKQRCNIYNLGRRVGLNKKDVDNVFKDIDNKKEQPCLTMGGPPYHGSLYAVPSIKNF